METLSKEQIMLLHKEGNAFTRKLLEEKYGEDFFNPSSHWIELFDLFCKKNNLTITQDARQAWAEPDRYAFIPFAQPEHKEEERDNASRMIRKILEINNKEKKYVPDYLNRKQEKWFPIGRWTETGLVFSNSAYGAWNSDTFALVGAPFVSPTSSEAKRIFIEYLPIYEKYLQ